MIISPLTHETNEHFNSLLTHIIILRYGFYILIISFKKVVQNINIPSNFKQMAIFYTNTLLFKDIIHGI